jgi:hypothetical protein
MEKIKKMSWRILKTTVFFLISINTYFGQTDSAWRAVYDITYPSNRYYTSSKHDTIYAKPAYKSPTDSLLKYIPYDDYYFLYDSNGKIKEFGKIELRKFKDKRSKISKYVKIGTWNYYENGQLIFVFDYGEGSLNEIQIPKILFKNCTSPLPK